VRPSSIRRIPNERTLIKSARHVEVLSPSTEGYDRGEKSRRYRQIESLEEYVLLSQDEPNVERCSGSRMGWLLNDHAASESKGPIRCLGSSSPERNLAKVTFRRRTAEPKLEA